MLRIQQRMCATCIFRPGNLMDLDPGRVEQMVADSVREDTAIICHDTLDATDDEGEWIIDVIGGPQAVCRGFYDRHKTQPLQVAERLELISWV